MKAFTFFSHPYTLLCSFSLVLISGQHLGGFYILYLLLGLPYGVLHSIVGASAIVLLIIAYRLPMVKMMAVRKSANLIGVGLMVLSLFLFFKNDKEHYNWGTFYQPLPMFTLVFTAFVALCFLIGIFWQAPTDGNRERSS